MATFVPPGSYSLHPKVDVVLPSLPQLSLFLSLLSLYRRGNPRSPLTMTAANPDPVLRQSISGRKGPLAMISHAKRLRSKVPRRKRIPPFPIVGDAFIPRSQVEEEAESSSSCFQSDISFESAVGFHGAEVPSRPQRAARQARAKNTFASIPAECAGNEFRRITRSFSKHQDRLGKAESDQKRKRGVEFLSDPRSDTKRSKAEASGDDLGAEIEVSEVQQFSGRFPDGNLKLNTASSETAEKAPAISESSCVESVSEAITGIISNSAADEGSRVQITDSTTERGGEAYDLDLNSDLACSERLSNENDDATSEYSTCNDMTQSEFDLEVIQLSSEKDLSTYSPSDEFSESADDFSERSRESSAPSATFTLFLQLAQQFARLSSSVEANASADTPSEEFTLMRFEDEEDEESYKKFRSRERNGVVLHDYAEDYRSSAEFSDLVLQNRLLMVNWIMEYSNTMEHQSETRFLGASLMDKFLSKGFFKSERNLQLLGIACLTLATRIEENQPYNSIRQKSFTVGANVYSRCDVVAMEWLVLQVVNFQCFPPTVHSFLWFYLKAARADAEVESLTRYLATLSILSHDSLRFWPSTVAAGLVILACLATNRDSSCNLVMETHVRNRNDDLPECIQSLEWLVKYAL